MDPLDERVSPRALGGTANVRSSARGEPKRGVALTAVMAMATYIAPRRANSEPRVCIAHLAQAFLAAELVITRYGQRRSRS